MKWLAFMDAGFLSPSFLLAADFHPSLFLVHMTFPIGIHCCVLKAVIQLCISFLLSLSLTFLSTVSLLSVETATVRRAVTHVIFSLSYVCCRGMGGTAKTYNDSSQPQAWSQWQKKLKLLFFFMCVSP